VGRGEDRVFIGHTRKIKLFDKVKGSRTPREVSKESFLKATRKDVHVNVKGGQEVMNPLQLARKSCTDRGGQKRQNELEEAKQLEGDEKWEKRRTQIIACASLPPSRKGSREAPKEGENLHGLSSMKSSRLVEFR